MEADTTTGEDYTAGATALWREYRLQKNSDSRNRLAEHYLPLIRIVAGRIAINLPAHIDKDDLLSSGFFGLLDAIERYDNTRQNKFETYASVRIRGAMLDYLRSRDWLPVAVRQKLRRYEKTVYNLENKLGREPSEEEIAAAMEITMTELKSVIGQLNAAGMMPLDDYLQSETPEQALPGPGEAIEKRELQDTLAKAIDRLPEKERLVVSLYYYEELTLKEISLIMHLTEARISQLHSKAVMRLRGHLARSKSSLL